MSETPKSRLSDQRKPLAGTATTLKTMERLPGMGRITSCASGLGFQVSSRLASPLRLSAAQASGQGRTREKARSKRTRACTRFGRTVFSDIADDLGGFDFAALPGRRKGSQKGDAHTDGIGQGKVPGHEPANLFKALQGAREGLV